VFQRIGVALMVSLLPVGVWSANGEVLDAVVAVVNHHVITAKELEVEATMLRHQLEASGAAIPPDAILRKQVLNHLIDMDLEVETAKEHAMNVDDPELDSTIEKIANNNKMTLTALREALEKQGVSWKNYRENIRKEMLVSRLQQQAISKEIVVSSQQVEDSLYTFEHDQKMTQTYHLQYLVIPLPEKATAVQEAAALVRAKAIALKIKKDTDLSQLASLESNTDYTLEGGDLEERHLAELPDLFAKKVVQMQPGDVSEPLRAGKGFQRMRLGSGGGDTTSSHHILKTHVRHILLKPDANRTAADAKKQVENIYRQVHAGKSFEVMAKQYSADPLSAVQGGDLGWVTEDELVPEFAKAMASLPLHQVSEPVQSAFGWHLIEVLERKDVDDTAAYKRQQVRQFLQQRKFKDALQQWQQHLRAEAYVKVLDKTLV
jgi:peptidyl-prolyl cis-trans isomerase SurA